jgi:hypothetical protein
MTVALEAREATGYGATWWLKTAGQAVDISGWTFEAVFEREAGAPDFTLGMAAMPGEEGFRIHAGAQGGLIVWIDPATLQAIPEAADEFTLQSDLLGTPPGGIRQFLRALTLTVTKGPTQ